MYEPLKITAWLQDGIATDATCPLDGILFYMAMREAYGPQDVTLSGTKSQNPDVALPITKINPDQPDWFYASSYAIWNGPVVEYTDYWNKRFDQQLSGMIDFKGKRGKVIIEQGQYKAYHMPINIRHALSLSWYVHGDGAWVENMLRFVSHIGKKTSQGDGAVLRWHVEPTIHDYSIYGPDAQLMRCVPSTTGRGLYVGFRPSYWMRENQTICSMP